MRIVLLGGSGFIGRELAPLLAAAGHEVVAPTRGQLDLLRDDPVPRFNSWRADTLVHLAWDARPGQFWNAPENLDWVAASLRLVRAFAAAGGRRVVVSGSCAEYDWSQPLLSEDSPRLPHTLYGAAKSALFDLLMAAADRLAISVAWGRVFFPYGPYEAPGRLFSSLVDGIAAGAVVETSSGVQERDFLHVDDVAQAFALLAHSAVEGAVNIASGNAVPVREFIARTASLMGGEHLVALGARPLQAGEPSVMVADVRRLRDLGFAPKFDLETGLVDAVRRRVVYRATLG